MKKPPRLLYALASVLLGAAAARYSWRRPEPLQLEPPTDAQEPASAVSARPAGAPVTLQVGPEAVGDDALGRTLLEELAGAERPTAAPEDALELAAGVRALMPGYELDPSEEPTGEGLFARTVGQWSQEGFLALTPLEVSALFPLDDELPAAPRDLREFLGFPTLAECEHALEADEVRAQLEVLAALEVVLGGLDAMPADKVTLERAERRRLLHEYRNTLEDRLMEDLDSRTGWPHWAEMQKLYRRWAQ